MTPRVQLPAFENAYLFTIIVDHASNYVTALDLYYIVLVDWHCSSLYFRREKIQPQHNIWVLEKKQLFMLVDYLDTWLYLHYSGKPGRPHEQECIVCVCVYV